MIVKMLRMLPVQRGEIWGYLQLSSKRVQSASP